MRTLCEGGIDFIKDDELQADGPHCPFEDRARAVMRVVDDHADRTGKKVMVAFNLTGEIDQMRRRDARRLVDDEAWEREIGRAVAEARAAGRDPLVYSAAGPDDPAVAAQREAVRMAGLDPVAASERLGAGLGRILRAIVGNAGLTRAAIPRAMPRCNSGSTR